LERGLDRQDAGEPVTLPPLEHANLRGAEYYAASLLEEVAE